MGMAGKVTPMDVRLLAAVTGSLEGVNVSEVCRVHGISRKTFYKWRHRFEVEGLAGLEERSRRPLRSPRRVGDELEDLIVECRKRLAEDGWDAGPATIRWYLARSGVLVPSEATIWRILVRRGFVLPEPRKRPRSSWQRFESAAPNECWQIDATHWELVSGETVEILNIVDDHSRVLIAARAMRTVTTHGAWETFSAAAAVWGLPSRCLSDNGLVFTGRLQGFEVFFETQLRAAGVLKINSRPFHPQTCGKVERLQQTEQRWLAARADHLDSVTSLQDALDVFTHHYNHDRPHRAIGRVPPIQRFTTTAPAGPGDPLRPRQRHVHAVVAASGRVEVRPFQISLGVRYAGQPAVIVIDGHHATVFIDGQLVRHLELDPNRRFQALHHQPGRPRTTQ